MNAIKRELIDKLAHEVWDFEDDEEYAVTEVYDVEWVFYDKYVRIGFYLYRYSQPEDYAKCTLYVSHNATSGILEEINIQHQDALCEIYYYNPYTNELFTQEQMDESEYQWLISEDE